MPPSWATVPSKPQHASVTGSPPLNPITPVHRSGDLAAALVVAGGGFRPQVKLGTVGLDLAPGRENAKPNQREQQQLLHGADPFTLCHAEPARHGRPAP